MHAVARRAGTVAALALWLGLGACGGEGAGGPTLIQDDEGLDGGGAAGLDGAGDVPGLEVSGEEDAGGGQPIDAGSAGVSAPAGAVMLAATAGARRFALSHSGAWWVDHDGKGVRRVSLDGGAAEEVANELGMNVTGDIAVHGQTVFWTALGPKLYFIRKLDIETKAKATVLSAKPQIAPQIIDRIVADATHVYFTTGSNPGPNYTGLLRRVKVGEGVAEDLRQWQKEPTGLALSGDHVYWTTRKGPAVQRVGKDGSGPIVVVKDVTGALAVAVDDTFAYFCNAPGLSADLTAGTVMRAARDGGPPVTIAADQRGPVAIAVGDKWVWWVNQGTQKVGWVDGELVRFSRDGKSKPEVVFAGLARPVDLALDASAVLWLTAGSEHPDHTKVIPGALFKAPL